MGKFLDIIYDAIFHPRRAMRMIAEERLAGQALFLFFLSMLMPPWTLRNTISESFPLPVVGAAMAVEFLACFAVWFLAAAVLSIVAEICGGRGSAVGLFAALGFSFLPRIVIMPLWALAAFLPEAPRAVAVGVVGTIVAVWIFFLSAEAVRAAYNISFVRAVLVMIFPVLAMLGVMIGLAVFTGAVFVSWFGY